MNDARKKEMLEYLNFFAYSEYDINALHNHNSLKTNFVILDELFELGFIKLKKGEYIPFSKPNSSLAQGLINNITVMVTKDGYDFLSTSIEKTKILFDTNIFDKLVDGQISLESLEKSIFNIDYFVTHIQIDEINKCNNEDRRARLSLFTTKIRPLVLPTESFILGTSRLGFARLSDGKLLEELRKENLKNTNDALIAETAIKNNCLLVTEDDKLLKKVISLDGKVISFNDFKRLIE